MRIEEALNRFLVQLQADGRSPHTIGQYRRHIRLFAHWARQVGHGGDKIEKLGHEDVARFLASAAANTRPDGRAKLATSANCLRSSLKGFFGYLHRAGYIGHDPGRLIRRAVCSPPPPQALSDKDQRRLLTTLAKATHAPGRRDHALFHLMLRTGIRVGSAVAVDAEDVDLERGELRIRTAKGNQPERILLGKGIQQHLRRYLGHRRTGPVFTGRGGERITTRHVQRRFRQWLKKADITHRASPHSLRHSFGMRIYGKTHDLLLTKEALRHRSIASTLVYARADQQELRRVLA